MRRFLPIFVACSLYAGTARGDWPSSRYDASRTAAAAGTSDITTPGSYWRAYLGGVVGLTQAIELENAGEEIVLYASAGRVHAATPQGIPLWESDNLSIVSLTAVVDLDGDGLVEVVAQSTAQVFAFDAATGAPRWAEEPGEMGTIGGVLATDVNGDGLAEIVVSECGCCALNSGETGYVYGFSGGFFAPERRWRLPFAFCGGYRSMLVDDLDGDGDADLLLGDDTHFEILDGATGASLAASAPLGHFVGYSYCQAVDLDGLPGKELICAHGTELESAGAGHRMLALHFASAPARIDVLWSTEIGDRDRDLVVSADSIRDLDDDGALELVVSGTAADRDLTVVIDAATGGIRTTLLDEIYVGTAGLGAGNAMVTRSDNHLRVWSFEPTGSAPLRLLWLIKSRHAVATRDWTLAAKQSLASRLLLSDVDRDGVDDLFTVDSDAAWQVRVQSLALGLTLREWDAVADADVLGGWGPVDDRLLISTADGELTTLDSTVDNVLGRFRAGGYYATGAWSQLPWTPVAGDLDGDGSDEVVVADSRKTMVALDLREASNAAPPTHRWERVRSYAPAIVPGLGAGASSGIVCRRADLEASPPTELVALLSSDGSPQWETPINSTLVYEDIVTGDFDGDSTPDLAVQWGARDDLAVRTTAFAGTDGRPLWTAATTGGQARFPAGVSVADWDGDGTDDVYFHHYGTRVLSGVDGAELAIGGPSGAAYFMPTLIDLVGDARPEVVLQGGYAPSEALSSDLTSAVWAASDDDRPFPYAAIANCSSGPVLVAGSLMHGSRLKVTLASGPSAGTWQSVVLARGGRYADEAAAVSAGLTLDAQLTSVQVHADLTGLGHPSAVVGSTDGWLYSVDPCSMGLDFAMAFGAPVGAVAFADGDGDGLDEIVVSTADGFLHGIRQQPIATPTNVRDVDPRASDDVDVDEVVTVGSLSAAWDPVEGALGYEVTMAHADGGIIATPTWQRVEATFVTFAGLPLDDGERYTVSVRALSAEGPSPDVLSDGVLVHLEASPDAGVGPDAGDPVGEPGGCCSTSGGGAPSSSVLALLLVLLRARRGRRR